MAIYDMVPKVDFYAKYGEWILYSYSKNCGSLNFCNIIMRINDEIYAFNGI